MNRKINGKIGQYVIMRSVIRSIVTCLALMLLGGAINWISGKGGINIVFLDQYLILSIGMGNSFDIQSIICGKAHVFTSSRKKIFRSAVQSALASTFVFALWRTFCQCAFYAQYVQEFSEDEVEPVVLTRIPVPEMFACNFILVLTACLILLWRFGMSMDYGVFVAGMNKKEWSVQMQYLAAVRKKRSNMPRRVGRLAYRLLEFIILVAVMVYTTFLYYFQLQSGMPERMGTYGVILVIGIVFFLLAKRRFRPEYM